ncbi:MAG: YbgC/FadM family acyl-CoA thioesterase [Planktomarina sp.]
MTHRFAVTVYYEDTDMGGIVYYANYLRFIERARSTWVAELGVDQLAMKEDGVVFAVRRVEADYLAPAMLGDRLEVRTEVEATTSARWILRQDVWCDDRHLFAATVTIVAIGDAGQPVRLPAELRRVLN